MKHETIAAQPVIDAGRFVLRPLRPSDAGLISFYTNDRRVAEQTTHIPHPLPPGATEAYIGRARDEDRRAHVWALDGAEHGLSEVLGLISLREMDRDQSEVSYWVAPAFWNAGYASEALAALLKANPLGNKTIFASVFQDNARSARVLTNAGFVYLGDAEAYSVARGKPVATWTYLRRLGDAGAA
ncbi:MAG: GNAT family N-acetyltransferase [Rhodobacteraceae bacterium]|nr:GNAT family N-acetyltransferase [Paracoccaceae bacterium]